MFTIYILYSKILDKFYIGFTSGDVEIRLKKHLINHKGFTSRAKDWQIVYRENFSLKTDAMKREKQLKGWKNNNRIKELIVRSSNE